MEYILMFILKMLENHTQQRFIYKTSFITTNLIWKLLDKLTSSSYFRYFQRDSI